jgi:hypothetical protein
MNLAKRKLVVDFTLAAFFAGFMGSPMSTPISIVLHLEGGARPAKTIKQKELLLLQ